MANARGVHGSAAGPTVASRWGYLACVLALVVLCWGIAQGVNPAVVLVAAIIPLAVALGYQYSLPILVAVLVIRPIVDGSGLFLITGGLGVGVIALAALVALHQARAALVLAAAAVPIGIAAHRGLEPWGDDAWTEGLRLLSIVSVAVVALVAPTVVTRAGAAQVVQVAGIIPAGVALYQAVAGTGTSIGAVLRSPGTLSQANPAAHFFSLCAVASLLLVVERHARRRDLALLAYFSVAIVTTGSIGGFITFIVAVLAYLVAVRGLFAPVTLGALGALAALAVGVVLSPLGQGRIAEFRVAPGPAVPDNSVTWRFTAWGKLIDAWQVSPIFGRGLGATVEGGILETNIGHNEYLYILTEMGLVGMVVVIGVLLFYIVGLVRFHRQGASRLNLALASALVLGTAVNAANDNPLHFSPSMFVVAFLLAVVWRCSSLERARARALSPAVAADGAAPGGALTTALPASPSHRDAATRELVHASR